MRIPFSFSFFFLNLIIVNQKRAARSSLSKTSVEEIIIWRKLQIDAFNLIKNQQFLQKKDVLNYLKLFQTSFFTGKFPDIRYDVILKLNSKVRFLITSQWISLKKGECFEFSHSLGSLPYVIKSEIDFQVEFIISAC